MVDALIHIHKQLKPGGLLINIQPKDRYLPVFVQKNGQSISVGAVDVENMVPKYHAAEQALDHVMQQSLYQFKQQIETDFLIYFDSAAVCRQYLADEWTKAHLPETAWQKMNELMHHAHSSQKIFFSEGLQFTRLSKTKK